MNGKKDVYDKVYKDKFKNYLNELKFLNGNLSLHPIFNTIQVNDYLKYNMRSFNEEEKKDYHDMTFDLDLRNAFQIGGLISL